MHKEVFLQRLTDNNYCNSNKRHDDNVPRNVVYRLREKVLWPYMQ